MAQRSWVAQETGRRLATQLADALMTSADTTGNLKEPLDDALRLLGYSEADVAAAESLEPQYPQLTLTIYTTLKQVRARIGDRFDVSSPRGSYRLNQSVKNVDAMLEQARADVIAIYGYMPDGSAPDDAGGVIEMSLGYMTAGGTYGT